MEDHNRVDRLQINFILQVSDILFRVRQPNSIDQNRFLVPDEVRVIRRSFPSGVFFTVESLQFPVYLTDPSYLVRHPFALLHVWSPLFIYSGSCLSPDLSH